MKKMDDLRQTVATCDRCGEDYLGKSACGIGMERKHIVLMVGMNPWTENGAFKNGRGITKLLKYLNDWEFTDFFFDNIVKCEMPDKKPPKQANIVNCVGYLTEQIEMLSPCYTIVFGEVAALSMGYPWKPWTEVVKNKVSVLPHFSSFLYSKNKKDLEEFYYKKLYKILFEAPKQMSLF